MGLLGFPFCPHQITYHSNRKQQARPVPRGLDYKDSAFVFIPDSQTAQRRKLGKVTFKVSEDPLHVGSAL